MVCVACVARAQYAPLSGGSFTNSDVAASPDPLVGFAWTSETSVEALEYQQFYDGAIEATLERGDMVARLDSVVARDCAARAQRGCRDFAAAVFERDASVRFKFAQEGASWLEMDACGSVEGWTLEVTLSESRSRSSVAGISPFLVTRTNETCATYRFESNAEHYDGVRYAWLDARASTTQARAWTLTALRRVTQVVPANYVGAFESSDAELDRVWYVGAYTTRACFTCPAPGECYLGSILRDRGDRVAFDGDAYVAQTTALAAFDAAFALANASLFFTKDTHGDKIEPYWEMWVLTVLDYVEASGDVAALDKLRPSVELALKRANASVLPEARQLAASLRWSRDDPRVGFGFEFPDLPEAQRCYRALAMGAMRRYGASGARGAAVWAETAARLVRELVAEPDWPDAWGLHAASDALNAGFVDERAAASIATRLFADAQTLPSLSAFESHFVLKALSKVNATRQAVALLKRQWGGMLRAGATTFWERYDPEWTDAGALRDSDAPPVDVMGRGTSMAHPWATGATSWLTRHALGVRATSPGFETFLVKSDLLQDTPLRFARGNVPLAGGRAIRVDLDLDAHQFRVELLSSVDDERAAVGALVPKRRLEARVGVPKLKEGLLAVAAHSGAASSRWSRFDNATVRSFALRRNETLASEPSQPRACGEDARFAYVCAELSAIAPRLELRFAHHHRDDDDDDDDDDTEQQVSSSSRAAPPTVDETTSGDWKGVFGSMGGVFFNYSHEGDVVFGTADGRAAPASVFASTTEDTRGAAFQGRQQPRPECAPFTANADRHQHAQTPLADVPQQRSYACARVFAAETLDTRALADPRSPSKPSSSSSSSSSFSSPATRAAAALGAGFWASFHVDVQLHAPALVTLYFLDFDNWAARLLVKTTDLATGATLAPAVLVDHFQNGTYLTYALTTSARFRVNPVHSQGDRKGEAPPALLSAVLFG